ncbi:MAG TPA: pyridoxamine 5'-phosphate oxidase family protein [Acetobacteraceae bacterium]|nr:pyridoxamine 5'-phosphate oxidase family protein [Acetobacteraceae bacterium]
MATPKTEDELRAKVRELMESIQICMFVTVDEQRRMRSRPMWLAGVDKDGATAWFFTRSGSPKAQEVGHDDRVLMAFSAPNKQDYVSAYGEGRIVHDIAKQKELWSEGMRAWFPNGAEDPKIALIAVRIEGAQYWDSPSSTLVHAYGYAKALLTGEPPHPGEVEKVKFA